MDNFLASIPILAPGSGVRTSIALMIQQGHLLRDNYVWQYPLLPGAINIYQEIASGREWKVSASTAAAAQRAVDWLNESVSYNNDGTIEYGFESLIKRWVLDYLCIGRIIATDKRDQFEYLDPVYMRFNFSQEPNWVHTYHGTIYKPSDLLIHHPMPIGGSGFFIAPLAPVIPQAMLAWLVREHDSASLDGRKIRDIVLVGSRELGEMIATAIEKSVALWSGADPRDNGVPIVYVESLVQGTKMEDYIARLGISNIPANFDRGTFEFNYANDIASVTGLALRQFYNSERATNRALEEVQATRQQQKGHESFIRSIQRMIEASKVLKKRFGNSVRQSFIEEADLESQTTRAVVLQGYATALEKFASIFGGTVNGDAFLAWLQSEGILPADLELITDLGTMVAPEAPSIMDTASVEANPEASALTSGDKTTAKKEPTPAPQQKSADVLDYDEVSVDSRGRIMERRHRVYTVEKII